MLNTLIIVHIYLKREHKTCLGILLVPQQTKKVKLQRRGNNYILLYNSLGCAPMLRIFIIFMEGLQKMLIITTRVAPCT